LLTACGGSATGGDVANGSADVQRGGGSGSLSGFSFDAGLNSITPLDNSTPKSGEQSTPTDASLSEDTACGASSVAAQVVTVEEEVQVQVEVPYEVEVPAPVALYVMFDRSKSMANNNLWDPAVTALSGFFTDGTSVDIDVALQYFPISGGSCADGSGYSTPAVDISRLPADASALTDSLTAESANGFSTPIEGALRGATEYCKAFQVDHPDEKCVAILVTDGVPQGTGCSSDSSVLTSIVQDAFDNFDVRTFAVGLQGADFTLLDQLAMAGGAVDCDSDSEAFACDISSGADQLGAALSLIRDTVTTTEIRTETRTETKTVTQQKTLDCVWQMPAPSGDTAVDIDLVNVELTGGTDGTLSLGRAADLSQCADRGWYYDDNDAPTQILACPETCDRIATDGYNNVNVLLGCAVVDLEVLQ